MKKIERVLLATFVGLVSSCLNSNPSVQPEARSKYSAELLTAFKKSPQRSQVAWVYLTDKETREGDPSDLEKLNQPISETYRKAIEKKGAFVRTSSRWLNAVSVEASLQTLSELGGLSFVRRIESVGGVLQDDSPPFTPERTEERKNQPPLSSENLEYGLSYDQLQQIGVPELHKRGLSGEGVTIAILDAGFRTDHEVFAYTNLLDQRNFVPRGKKLAADPNDLEGSNSNHGTQVWSVVGGFKEDELIGAAFGAKYLLARTEDVAGEYQEEEDFWVSGVEWAQENGANIVSSSLGYLRFSDGSYHDYSTLDGKTVVTAKIANTAAAFGILVINAMGNSGEDFRGDPRLRSLVSAADAFGVFAVGAVDSAGFIAPFSSRGPTADGRIKPDIVAQGVDIWAATADATSSYGCADGTSFATPLVAGVAALLWEAHPGWSALDLQEALRSTASQAEAPDNHYGHGIVNAVAALEFEPQPLLASAR